VHDGAEDKIYLIDLGSAQGTFVGNATSGIVRTAAFTLHFAALRSLRSGSAGRSWVVSTLASTSTPVAAGKHRRRVQVPHIRVELSEGDAFSFAASSRTYELRCSAEPTAALSEEEMIRVGFSPCVRVCDCACVCVYGVQA
jgi:hypothetical protein